MTVRNTHPDKPVVTLFGQLDDGSYAAKVMDETDVPYSRYWDNAVEQVMVYIEPDNEQVKAMVAALNDGRLDYATLQSFGAASGGTSTIPI